MPNITTNHAITYTNLTTIATAKIKIFVNCSTCIKL